MTEKKRNISTQGFERYHHEAWATAMYPNKGTDLSYPVLGLNGEAGEVAEKVKKVMRDKNGVVDDETRDAIVIELGDVIWYVNAICHTLGVHLGDVAEANLVKLNSRRLRGKIQGEGDNR